MRPSRFTRTNECVSPPSLSLLSFFTVLLCLCAFVLDACVIVGIYFCLRALLLCLFVFAPVIVFILLFAPPAAQHEMERRMSHLMKGASLGEEARPVPLVVMLLMLAGVFAIAFAAARLIDRLGIFGRSRGFGSGGFLFGTGRYKADAHVV